MQRYKGAKIATKTELSNKHLSMKVKEEDIETITFLKKGKSSLPALIDALVKLRAEINLKKRDGM